MNVSLYTCLRKSTHQDQNCWHFSLLLAFFENINQEHNLLPDCMPLDSLLIYCYHVVKIYVKYLLLLLLAAIFCLDQCQRQSK